MGPDPIQDLIREDKKLAEGAEVAVYWTEGGFDFRGRARIVELSPRTVRVALLENTGRHGGYAAGKTLLLPRISDPTRWSSQECVRLASS